jgi:O-antigen ligase
VFIIAITLIAGYNMKNIAAQILLFAFWGITLALAIVVFNTENPISQRFRDIYKPRTDLMENQVKLSPSDYLDGISLRLLFWKFGQHILEGKQSWLVGVSSGDSQRLLNEQITRAGLYRGEEGNSGYLNYNFHNQFVETTVQSGILGLACLSGIFIALIKHAIKYKNIFFLLLLLALFCFFLTESVLERQWGVISFALFSMVFVNLNMPWTSPLRK